MGYLVRGGKSWGKDCSCSIRERSPDELYGPERTEEQDEEGRMFKTR